MYFNPFFMASEHSMDIVVNFDMQEMRNAVDQAIREIVNRYDLKNSNIQVELGENEIKVNAETENQMEAVYDIVARKMAGRNLSLRILDRQKIEPAGGMRFRQEMKLIKSLDQENAKKISKLIKDFFPKAKASIQGDSVRVTSKSIDDLQAVIARLKTEPTITVPLQFTNYR